VSPNKQLAIKRNIKMLSALDTSQPHDKANSRNTYGMSAG